MSESSRGFVLVLEDDPGIRRLECSQLERAGYEVVAAGDYAEARALLGAKPLPDLLLLDYQLADGENGLEFYRQLAREERTIPAILVTGFGDEARVLEAMRAGVRDFVPKTPNFVELVPPTVERVLAQVQGERRLREAEAASRAKDDFLAALSHELRTPLTPVLAVVSAMSVDDRLPPDVRADTALIHRNILLEARLIDDLLDLTRVARGKLELRPETVDLCPILDHALRTCRGIDSAGKTLAWECRACPGPLWVQADSARLTQVFWNVLKNAAKFTPDKGQIRVTTEVETEADGQDWVTVRVTDSGIGMNPADLPRIFDAFEQGGRAITRQFGGLGLGLAISKAIIDLHEGTIVAASEGVGQGACFTVRLRRQPAPQPRLTFRPPGLAAPRGESGSGHLLLVEDHRDTAMVMARMLRRSGFHVTQASSVQDALEKAEANHQELDSSGRAHPVNLVVSDLGLPDGSGMELMAQLRDRYGLNGVALSGFGMEEDVRRSHEAGFAAHLTKPVDFPRLLNVIRGLMEGAEGVVAPVE